MDFFKGLQGVGFGCIDEMLLLVIVSVLYISIMFIIGQFLVVVEKNFGVWFNIMQFLCKVFMVIDEDIRKQEELVQQVWKWLEEVLMVDMLVYVEELVCDGEVLLDKVCIEDDDEEDEEEEEEEFDLDLEMEYVQGRGFVESLCCLLELFVDVVFGFM